MSVGPEHASQIETVFSLYTWNICLNIHALLVGSDFSPCAHAGTSDFSLARCELCLAVQIPSNGKEYDYNLIPRKISGLNMRLRNQQQCVT